MSWWDGLVGKGACCQSWSELLSSVPGIHMVEGENDYSKLPSNLHESYGTQVLTHIQINVIKNKEDSQTWWCMPFILAPY